jgi:tRNA(Ile)-lysidine synthase
VRPLLDCLRRELRAYLDERAMAYVQDVSNEDVSVPRNRVRLELLPLLKERFNPSIVDVLADAAALAREEWAWMQGVADEHARQLCRWTGRVCRIDAARLAGLPTGLARLVLREAMVQASGGRAISFAHVNEGLRASRLAAASLDLPGHRLERIGGDVVLTGRPDDATGRPPSPGTANLFRYSLSIPGEVHIAETDGRVSAEVVGFDAEAGTLQSRGDVARVQLGSSSGPFAVRNRRPGDRFRPLGVGGARKLQDLLVDRKVPRDERDDIPIVVDEADRIVWVAGHGIDERFRVMDPAQAVVVLRFRRV